MSLSAVMAWLFGTPNTSWRKSRRRSSRPRYDACVEKLEVRKLLAADLRPTLVDGPTSGFRGTSINVTTAVQNAGNVASGSYSVRYFASRDATKMDGLAPDLREVARTQREELIRARDLLLRTGA